VDANKSASSSSGLIGVYSMTCKKSNGQDISKTITIASTAPPPPPPPPPSTAPTVTLLANGQTALTINGGMYTLAWSSANVTNCTLSWSGSATGNQPVDPNGSTQSGLIGVYALTCI